MMSFCKPVDLQAEFATNPIGIGETKPRLSWKMDDPRPGARQVAWQVWASSSPEQLGIRPDFWDSGKIKSGQSLDIEYAGKPIRARQRIWWKVKIWDMEGKETSWSEPAFFEIGLLHSNDWTAKWIGPAAEEQPFCPYFRKSFRLDSKPRQARMYVTSRGLFEASANGLKIGKDFFTPGWTDFNKRIQVLTYDVTDLLKPGDNALGIILADGWYAGNLTWNDRPNFYGKTLSFLLQLEITDVEGNFYKIGSGPDWKYSRGPIVSSSIYHGETYDARLEIPGWNHPGLEDSSWLAPVLQEPSKARLIAKRNTPVRKQEMLFAQSLSEPRFGIHVFDLGQNMVGWAQIKARAQTGQTITCRFAEMLNPDGTLYVENLRKAKATDTYICKSSEEETWEPRFTFHGFRYVELTGLLEKPKLSDVTGIVLHTDLPKTGSFACSDPLINRLQENIQWGQKGNFLEVPTDCPQRDERLGWTGDAQVFIPTAGFNRDVAVFFEKWCEDIQDAQLPNGSVPHVVPNVLPSTESGCAAWADAAVICPWITYLLYQDRRILERQYSSMRAWVDWREKTSKNLIHDSACFGDWLAIDIAENDPGRSPTPRDLIATAYFSYTARILTRTAKILGKKPDVRKYSTLATKATQAFIHEFVSPGGRVVGDTQTGYLLALAFDLLPTRLRKSAARHLVSDIEKRGWRLSTGFVGTPLLAPVLSKIGRTDAAYKLLFQKKYPSWLYPVLLGATTMWERWNSYTPEKGFGDVGMNSFNHYAYGSVGEWIYSVAGGIRLDPKHPGYQHVWFHPEPGGGLTWAKTEIMTRYGRTACHWKIKKNVFKVEVTLPPNASGSLVLNGRTPRKIKAGTHRFNVRWIPEQL